MIFRAWSHQMLGGPEITFNLSDTARQDESLSNPLALCIMLGSAMLSLNASDLVTLEQLTAPAQDSSVAAEQRCHGNLKAGHKAFAWLAQIQQVQSLSEAAIIYL